MSFTQTPPRLDNQYTADRLLRSYLERVLPPDVLVELEPELEEMGELAGGELYRMQLADRLHEPRLVQWDAWGNRVDRIELTPLWQAAERIAAERGVVATAYDGGRGRLNRIHQFALVYLFHPSTDVYTCPLSMTDGAARTLLAAGNEALIERAVGRLTSRDPQRFWTSGQWMTETSGGSDVGRSQTVAQQAEAGWKLYGRKWFTSAIGSQMALTLARPEGNPPGGRGLALFYVETRDASGRLLNIRVDRLKDKLGTRKVPTAELTLDGTPAQLVLGTDNGVRNIVPMLKLTRTWNGVCAVAFMRRGLALARDYAGRREAFGKLLANQPLHADTLDGIEAETEAAFHLAFLLVDLIGREEAQEIDDTGASLLRLLTSIVKLTTGRQAVAAASEVLEAFGGAGYIEDTGLPTLLRDSQVLTIWEGTTNVLALDALRAIEQGLQALQSLIEQTRGALRDAELAQCGKTAAEAVGAAHLWLERTGDRDTVESGARRFALTLGRATALALTAAHAQWALDERQDSRSRAAALRFAQHGVNQIFTTPARVAESPA
ncbi:hypothetical protein BH24PSE2_BH24PSE2_22350 [soil metagenome]